MLGLGTHGDLIPLGIGNREFHQSASAETEVQRKGQKNDDRC